jgi:uncharacterized protein
MSALENQRDRLLDCLRKIESCAVAFSGGVDSAVVAKAAHIALGESSVAVTAVSPSLAAGELEQAVELAALIGIRHEVVETNEMSNRSYLANGSDRCYHCKMELYTHLQPRLEHWGVRVIVNGANRDDLDDYRPGLQAANEHAVLSPLAECGLTKTDVRQLAEAWQLPVWNKPAMPCLASRLAYGLEVTPERLAMVDRAEQFLREAGYETVRVRYHDGGLARLEVAREEVAGLAEPEFCRRLVAYLHKLGFHYVAVDLEGFRSGSGNLVLPPQGRAGSLSLPL